MGIDPDQDLHARTHLRFRSYLSAIIGVREGHADFGPCSHTSFESLRPPRSPAGRKPRTSQPPLHIWAAGTSRAIPKTHIPQVVGMSWRIYAARTKTR